MANSKINFENLRVGKLKACAYDDAVFTQKVTLVRSVIPRVVYSWTARHYLSLTQEQADELGAEAQTSSDGAGKFVWCVEMDTGFPVISHVTLMNFRRYGWCTSHQFDAEHGYAGGIVYANKIDGGLAATDPRQVIRDTLIAVVAVMPYTDEVPHQLVDSYYSREALEYLLADALENTNHHAEPRVRDLTDKSWDVQCGVSGDVLQHDLVEA